MGAGKQNDVSECMDNVLFQIETALDTAKLTEAGVSDGRLVQKWVWGLFVVSLHLLAESRRYYSLFYGKTRQRLEFDDAEAPEPVRIKEEPFSYLLVDVAEEGKDLYDGLDASFQDAQVEIDGLTARRRVAVVDLPPVLQIQLQVRGFGRAALCQLWWTAMS
jgi:ubiquitin carboxyl-terminal hydrolase 25/28